MSHSIIYFRSILYSRALLMSRSARVPATPKRALINLEVIYTDLYPSELSGVHALLSKSHIIFIDSFFAAIALSKFSAEDIRFQISSEITLSYG